MTIRLLSGRIDQLATTHEQVEATNDEIMFGFRIDKWVGVLLVLTVAAVLTVHLLRPARSSSFPQPKTRAEDRSRPHTLPAAPERAVPAAQSDAQDAPSVDFDWRQILQNTKLPPRLPREKVEAFLEKRQRNAESLLAAYHALEDRSLLAEAANRFPNNPRVQWTVLSRNLFPEDRRKWLELFKASSPDNALANYLSAQDLMQNKWDEATGKYLFGANKLPLQDFLKTSAAQAAINELVEATSKPQFKDFALESRLDEEELNLAAGRSTIQARLGAAGWNSDLMPELANFKSIAICLQELQKSYLSAGDTASAQNLLQMGLTLAGRLGSGDSGKLVINQLVATASKAILLRPWDANTSYDFLGGRTPNDWTVEMKAARASLRSLADEVEQRLPTLDEPDLVSYSDRERVYGEVEAMRWLLARTQLPASLQP